MARTPAGARLLVVPAATGADLLADFDGERGERNGAPFLIAGSTYLLALAVVHLLMPKLEPVSLTPRTSKS